LIWLNTGIARQARMRRMSRPVANPVAAWHEEHAYFRRLLDLLHREVEVFPRGEQPNYELMLDILSYLRDYGDQYHHPREDVAFRRLVRRLPVLELPLARLRQEHRVIARAGEILRGHLEAIVAGAVVRVEDIETAAATYLVYYGNHISKEEEDVLPAANAALTIEDWAEVRGAVRAAPDPLFGDHPENRYRELRRRIALDA
jgi:hemerythrin-like domain-containing protein